VGHWNINENKMKKVSNEKVILRIGVGLFVCFNLKTLPINKAIAKNPKLPTKLEIEKKRGEYNATTKIEMIQNQ